MKPENILEQIGVNKTPRNKEHARKLIEIYRMLSGIKSDIISAEREKTEFNFGKETASGRWGHEDRFVKIEGDKIPSEVFTIQTKTGTYKQTVPINNDLHRAFCDLIGQSILEAENPLFTVTFDKEQTKFIKRALVFCSTDSLRPTMNCMKFEFSPGKVNIVAMDEHRIIKRVFTVECEETRDVLIPATSLKTTIGPLELRLYNKYYSINSQRFKYPDLGEDYPKYMSVWPEYKGEIVVNRKHLLDAIKSMKATANVVTKAMRLKFNGNVKIEAENIDFGNESGTSIEYERPKTAPDFEIGVNAKFLIDALELSKEFEVTIKTDGASNKALVLNNEALVMPVKFAQ